MSATSLGTLLKCQQMYYWRYVMGKRVPPGVALVIGKGAHGSAEKDLVNKQEWGELLSDEAVADHARDATVKAWEKEEPVRHDGDPDKGGAVDTAVALAGLHHKQLAPKIEPVAVERGFRLEIPDFPYDVVGYVDVEEERRIRDLKTSAKTPPEDAAEKSDQLSIYALEAAVRGAPKQEVAMDHLVKTSRPQVVTRTATRGPEDHARLMLKLEIAAKVIQSGNFLPCAPDSWTCGAKWCGFWDAICPHGRRGAVSVGMVDISRLRSRPEERR